MAPPEDTQIVDRPTQHFSQLSSSDKSHLVVIKFKVVEIFKEVIACEVLPVAMFYT